MLSNLEAIDKLNELSSQIDKLKNSEEDSPNFKKWKRDVEISIENIFGNDTRHLSDFRGIQYSPSIFIWSDSDDAIDWDDSCRSHFLNGLEESRALFSSFIKEINEYRKDIQFNRSSDIFEYIKIIINRFHQVARQLKIRHSERSTIKIEDEYDVQDLFHALLKLYFDDVREEEWIPSYAGASSRTDFLLKNEKVIIEIKKTRKTLKAKEIGEQLIIDSVRYKSHPDCGMLICFVYDPDEFINNPKGLENDLTKEFDGVPVYTYIRPE